MALRLSIGGARETSELTRLTFQSGFVKTFATGVTYGPSAIRTGIAGSRALNQCVGPNSPGRERTKIIELSFRQIRQAKLLCGLGGKLQLS